MVTTDINDAALAFGLALRQAPAVAAYLAAVEAFEADPSAPQVMAALQTAQASYLRTEQAGLTPSQEQVDQLRSSQATLRSNEVVMNHLRATNTVKKYLPMAASAVSAALGADYASLIAPATGC
jgi:cell fate (sporulation/competence/biofilm development) regulator YlbF (YheA/YmcA/DUF963 family)